MVGVPPFSDENVKYLGAELLYEVHLQVQASQEAYCKEITTMMNLVCADFNLEPYDTRSMLVRARLLGLQQVQERRERRGELTLLQSRRESLYRALDTIVDKIRNRPRESLFQTLDTIVDTLRNGPSVIVPSTPPPVSSPTIHSPISFTPMSPSTPPSVSFPPAGANPRKFCSHFRQARMKLWSLMTTLHPFHHLLLTRLHPCTFLFTLAARSLHISIH